MNKIPEYQLILGVPPALSENSWVAIDIELFGAEKRKLHRPTTGTLACVAFACENTVWVIDDEKDVPQALKNVDNSVWVGMNFKFDLTHLRRWAQVPPRKKIFDTMLMERILGGGLYGDFSLADLVRRYLNIKMDKSVRKTFESATVLTDEQIMYNAEDALLTLLVCKEQLKHMDKNDFKVWTSVDRPALWSFMDFQGFRIDDVAWMELHGENKARADEIKASLSFNPASPQQVKAVLTKGGFKRLSDTGVQSIIEAVERYPKAPAVDVAQQVLEYRMYAKRASTYGKNFLDTNAELESPGVLTITSNYWITGAETGRPQSCVSGDTLLETTLGIFRIDSLPTNSSSFCGIMSHSGKVQPILSQIYKGKQEMFCVTLENGCSIKCTKDHRFLTTKGWKKLNDIHIGDNLFTSGSSHRWSHNNLERRRFQKALFGDRCHDFRYEEKVWHESLDNDYFDQILRHKISRGSASQEVKNTPKQFAKSLANDARLHATSTTSANYSLGQTTARIISCRRSHRVEDSQTFGSFTRNSSEKFQKAQDASSIGSHVCTESGTVECTGNTGKFLSWVDGHGIQRNRKSTGVLRETLRCQNCYVSCRQSTKWYIPSVFSLCTTRKSKEKFCLMETELPRNCSVRGIEKTQNISCSELFLGNARTQIFSRHLHSAEHFNRDKWINSQTGKDASERKGQNRTCQESQPSPTIFSNARTRNELRQCSRVYSTSNVKSIESVGILDVWDIEVANDHSYIAQGFVNHNSDPCMTNIPARKTPKYRECFIARPGHKLVVCDVGQQEPRDAAVLSMDKELIKVFKDKSQDVYCNMALQMYGQKIDKSHPFRRQVKNTVLGVTYGMSAPGMARRYEMTEDEAQKAINDFFSTFTGLHYWIEQQKRSTSDYVETLLGRKIYINQYSDQAERNRINGPCQGTAADQMKMSLGRIYTGWSTEFPGIPFGCVGFIYDELIFDVPEKVATRCAEYVSHHIITTSEETVNHVVPFVVDTAIGDSWACKH